MEERILALSSIEKAAPLLTAWFLKNKRYMPWREDPTPYHVWVSEIMLQQTRVDTVMPYYERFIRALPDVDALAHCEEDRLLKLFEGLGYYSRVRNMQKAAVKLTEENGGKMPETFEELRALPGIGDYTAGAISSIAGHRPEPVVDGNVLRVISRLLGSYEDIDKQKTRDTYAALLRTFLAEGSEDPSVFNQGLMELGALVCVPNGAPKCESCPWESLCVADCKGLIDDLPVRTPKKARKIEQKTVLILVKDNRCGIVKREEKGLLSGLYGFPSEEGILSPEEALDKVREYGFEPVELTKLKNGKHVFSHVEWHMQAYRIRVAAESEGSAIRFAGPEELESTYALPAAFRKWEIFP